MTNRLERGLEILERLKQGVPLAPTQLAKWMDVSRRTIFRDIAALRQLGFDIQFDTETSCYSYVDPANADPKSTTNSNSEQSYRSAFCFPLDQLMQIDRMTQAINDQESITMICRGPEFENSENLVVPERLSYCSQGWKLTVKCKATGVMRTIPLLDASYEFQFSCNSPDS